MNNYGASHPLGMVPSSSASQRLQSITAPDKSGRSRTPVDDEDLYRRPQAGPATAMLLAVPRPLCSHLVQDVRTGVAGGLGFWQEVLGRAAALEVFFTP
jgi:hypothetical protein